MKIAVLVLLMVFILPVSTVAGSEDKSSYELFYPIVAGKIPGDKWYGLKIIREKVVAIFLLEPNKKIEFHSSLSQKRLVEAEKLIVTNKNYPTGLTTLEESSKQLKLAWKIARENKLSSDVLKNESQTISSFMLRLADEMPTDKKSSVVDLSQSLSEEVK